MSKIDDGGPAFPTSQGNEWADPRGMSLRAWLAGQALNPEEFRMLRDQYFAWYPNREAATLQQLRLFHADALIAELRKEG